MIIVRMTVLLSVLLMSTSSYATEPVQVYKLNFPQINLNKEHLERIEEVYVSYLVDISKL